MCENGYKSPLATSIHYVGVLVGTFISGQMSDRYCTVLIVVLNTQILLLRVKRHVINSTPLFIMQIWEEAITVSHDGSSDCGNRSTDILPKLGDLQLNFFFRGCGWILQLYHCICAGYVFQKGFPT